MLSGAASRSEMKKVKDKKEFWLLTTLFVVHFTHIFDFVIMMPLGPLLMEKLSFGPTQFASIVSVYAFSAGISSFFSSFWVDRFDRKSALIWVYLGFIFGNLLCATATSYFGLLIARIVAGAFGGVLGGITFSIVGDEIPESRRGHATGIVMSAFSVASVIGVPVGILLANKFDWHAPFYFISFISLFVMAAIKIKIYEMKGHMNPNATGVKFIQVLKYDNHRKALTLTLCLVFAGFMVIPFISPYMVANVGLKQEELAYLYFFGGGFTFLTSRYIGKLSDKFGKHKMFSIIAIASIIPIIINTNMPKMPLYWVIPLNTLFFILVSGRFVPAMSIITSSTHRELRGAFMGVNNSVQALGMGVASSIGGYLITEGANGELFGYHIVGFIACCFTIVSIFLAKRVRINA